MSEPQVLFLPGPTEVDAELRELLARPLVGHRDPKFAAVVAEVCEELRSLYLTRQHAAFETCAATALMEAAIRNLVPHGGRTLHLVGGAFGARWRLIAERCGRTAEAHAIEPGQAHDPAALRAALTAAPPVAAVCITHNETATGVLQPLAELAAAARAAQPDALVLVDAVSSLGGAELRFDDWGLDLAFAGTQKCLALPPGLCTYAVSDRALARAADVDERGWLLDLPRAVPRTAAGRTLATPNVPLVLALRRQLERIAAETLPVRWARHRAMRDLTLRWAGTAGLRPFVADAAARSPTISCLAAPAARITGLVERAAAAGFALARGYGELADTTLRIGHLGDHTVNGLRRLLATLG